MELQKQLRQQSTLLFRLCKHQNCPSTSFPQPIRFDVSGSPSVQSRVMRPSNLFCAHLKTSQKLRFSDKALYYPQNCIIVERASGNLTLSADVCSHLRKTMLPKEISYLNQKISKELLLFCVVSKYVCSTRQPKKRKIRFASSQTPAEVSMWESCLCVEIPVVNGQNPWGSSARDAEPRELVHIHRFRPQCERRSIRNSIINPEIPCRRACPRVLKRSARNTFDDSFFTFSMKLVVDAKQ